MDCCKFSYFSDKKDFVAIKTVIMTMKSTFMLMIPVILFEIEKTQIRFFVSTRKIVVLELSR